MQIYKLDLYIYITLSDRIYFTNNNNSLAVVYGGDLDFQTENGMFVSWKSMKIYLENSLICISVAYKYLLVSIEYIQEI